jgi:FimV-like protein
VTLAARIPPRDVFWRANLEPPLLLDQLRARVERRPNGRYVVSLSSTRPLDSPFMQLLVELDSPAGRVLREYPFLLEESGRASTSPAPPIAAMPELQRAASEATAGTYVVKPGDTLAAIARATRAADATVEQTVVAIYQANEPAFVGANMNRLPVGALLTLPSDGAAKGIEPDEARRLILVHRTALHRSGREDGRAGAVPGEGPTSATPAGAVVPSPPASADQLRLAPLRDSGSAGGSADSARNDDIVALQRALAETQERIALLQRELEDVRRWVASSREPPPGSVDQRNRSEFQVRVSGNATAGELQGEGTGESWMPAGLAREHGGWFLATFLVGFALWVVMPVKTTQVWLHRRRQGRAAMQAALDQTRPPRLAAATRSSRFKLPEVSAYRQTGTTSGQRRSPRRIARSRSLRYRMR